MDLILSYAGFKKPLGSFRQYFSDLDQLRSTNYIPQWGHVDHKHPGKAAGPGDLGIIKPTLRLWLYRKLRQRLRWEFVGGKKSWLVPIALAQWVIGAMSTGLSDALAESYRNSQKSGEDCQDSQKFISAGYFWTNYVLSGVVAEETCLHPIGYSRTSNVARQVQVQVHS